MQIEKVQLIQARGTTRNTCHEAWKLHLSISESWQTAAHLLPREEKHAVELVSEERVATRKHKAEAKASEGGSDHWAKRAKTVAEERAEDVKKAKAKGKEQAEDVEKENGNEKSTEEIIAEFEKFCKAMSEHLSLQQMREILEANGGVNDVVVPGCQDVLFCGTLDKCPACGGTSKMS